MISFKEQVKEWSSPPVDDIGYIPSATLLALPEDEFKVLMANAEHNRYSGWRNWNNRWREVLGLDSTEGKSVLDYGSGIGLESLQYARKGNSVRLADISWDNLRVAGLTLVMWGHMPEMMHQIREHSPFIPNFRKKMDIIHCAGVLHHIPEPEPVVEKMAHWLKPDGELRLMVYSDKAWEMATATEPPEIVQGHPKAIHYARSWDGVGQFADWYDAARLKKRFGKWFKLETYEDLTENGAYVGAVLRKRS